MPFHRVRSARERPCLDEVLLLDAREPLEVPWSSFISIQGISMQSNIVPTEVIQPFVKLAQANMELWSKFSFSPEVMSEATRNIKGFLEQSQASTASLAHHKLSPASCRGW